MAYSNIVHDCDYYTSSIACAVNTAGVYFVATVINKPGDQYCAITRVDVTTKEEKEIARLRSADSKAMLVAEGANPANSGKYGNVAIAVHGADIFIVLEMRYDDVNKQRWGILRGLAV